MEYAVLKRQRTLIEMMGAARPMTAVAEVKEEAQTMDPDYRTGPIASPEYGLQVVWAMWNVCEVIHHAQSVHNVNFRVTVNVNVLTTGKHSSSSIDLMLSYLQYNA